jgi:hypothetical protein
MRKHRVIIFAGAIIVLAMLVLAGASIVRADNPADSFTGFGEHLGEPCAAAFGGPLSAKSSDAYVVPDNFAGGDVPECGFGAIPVSQPQAEDGIAGGRLDISVGYGNASSLSFLYSTGGTDGIEALGFLGGLEVRFYRGDSLLDSQSLSGFQRSFYGAPAGGFDEVIIKGFGSVDNVKVTFGPPAPELLICPDDRINCHLYDDKIVLYRGADGDSIDVWTVGPDSEGEFLFSITAADFGDYLDNPPDMPVLIKSVGLFDVYILPTGEVQVNYGPDAEGKSYVIIMSGIGGGSPHGYTLP